MTTRPVIRRSSFRLPVRVRLPFRLTVLAVLGALLILSWATLLSAEATLLQERARGYSLDPVAAFVGELLGIGSAETPAYLQPAQWIWALGLAIETLAMSILAAAIASAVVLPTVLLAARNVAFGNLQPSSSPIWPIGFLIVRVWYLFTRSVPELIWAMLIVFVLNPGILSGALALAIHNIGVLGKLGAEVIEDVDVRPLQSLQHSGAGSWQVLAYGVIPMVLPQFLTYLLYRWEVIMRTTIVVGFVAAGGLGREFRLNMSWFHYTEVTLILLVYLGLVVLADSASGLLRRLGR